tara:strand:- start:322 stop:657 length:336 start_codon:yes stop_codon:yes gene_type:complete
MEIIVERFAKHLTHIEYPTTKASWNIAGVLKGRSNQSFKYDVRDMFLMTDGRLGKKGKTNSMADKMVFETEGQWIILDVQEIYKYIKNKKTKLLYLDDLVSQLEWSIYLPK